MAKKARKANGKTSTKKHKGRAVHEAVSVGGNYKRAVKDFVGRIENVQKELVSEKSKYTRACQPLQEDIKELYAEAKAEGIKPKALKAEIKIRELARKQEAERDKLDTEDQDELDRIRLAMGELADTPLGEAALSAATAEAQAEQPPAEQAH